jgi:hypothetical protein
MESDLLSISQQFSGLPMDALIGGPLNAAARANAAMALTQTKFMLDTCFVLEDQLVSLDYRLLRAARAFLDPELQAGITTQQRALDILTKDVVQSPAFARQEVVCCHVH